MKQFIKDKRHECKSFMFSCIAKRIEQIEKEFEKTDEYTAIDDFHNSLCKSINDIVPKDKMDMVNEYRLGIIEIMDYVKKYYYTKGLEDGLALFDVICDEKYKKGTIVDCMKEMNKNNS